MEEYSVSNAILTPAKSEWTITSESNDAVYRAKILIIADGSSSRLGRILGYVDEPPQAICSRAYIEAGSYQYPYDGVCYYPPKLVPGYCSLFKQANGDIGYCCYIIPGGSATTKDLREYHHEFISKYAPMSNAIGPNPKLEPMKAAPIRFGGIEEVTGIA